MKKQAANDKKIARKKSATLGKKRILVAKKQNRLPSKVAKIDKQDERIKILHQHIEAHQDNIQFLLAFATAKRYLMTKDRVPLAFQQTPAEKDQQLVGTLTNLYQQIQILQHELMALTRKRS